MHCDKRSLSSFLLTFLFITMFCAGVYAQTNQEDDDGEFGTVLETYILDVGNSPIGVKASLLDGSFGGGDAESSVNYSAKGNSGRLKLKVQRTVPPGNISFALLVFGIEVRGYDADGDLILKESLEPFSFGDSASGNWSKTLRNIPVALSRLEVRFFGNYE